MHSDQTAFRRALQELLASTETPTMYPPTMYPRTMDPVPHQTLLPQNLFTQQTPARTSMQPAVIMEHNFMRAVNRPPYFKSL